MTERQICATCRFFKAAEDRRLFDGACHNMRATLGAVIQTGRNSTCNHHTFDGLGERADEAKEE